MGFTLAEGPEIDDDLHVFTKLNFAADHPARDMQDTFFIEQNPNEVTKNILLRSHTSNDQSRIMESSSRPSALSARVAYIATRPSRLVPTASSISSKAYMLTKRVVHRPQAGASHLCSRALWCRHQDTSAPQLLSLHRAQRRDGHLMPHLWWQGLRFLQAHWLGRDFRLRHGRPQRA